MNLQDTKIIAKIIRKPAYLFLALCTQHLFVPAGFKPESVHISQT